MRDKREKKNREEIIRRTLTQLFLIQAEAAIGIGVIGVICAKEVLVGFNLFFLPLIISLICIVPCTITYLYEGATVAQVLLQRTIEWGVIEVAVEALLYKALGNSVPNTFYVVLFFATLITDVTTYIISDYIENIEISSVNEQLKSLKNREDL